MPGLQCCFEKYNAAMTPFVYREAQPVAYSIMLSLLNGYDSTCSHLLSSSLISYPSPPLSEENRKRSTTKFCPRSFML